MNDGRVQFKLRVPDLLKEMVEHAAAKNGRSINAEATARLFESFWGKPRMRVKMGRAVEQSN